MTTIRRHPVPTDSYDPKRPLNDLLIAQFEHFKSLAAQLPAKLAAGVPPVPAQDDSEAVGNFIAAITKVHVSRKKQPRLLPQRARKALPATLALAASAEDQPHAPKPQKSARKPKPMLKSKPSPKP